MTEEERLKQIKKQLEKSAQELFKKKPDDVQEELENTTVFGSPENLTKPDEELFDEEKDSCEAKDKPNLKSVK